ncbi:MAG: cytochrome c [Planctomycetota bacterium]|nr:cytochrome c [Planctomycetota bacterium]
MQRVQSIMHSALFLLLLGFTSCDSLGEAAAQGTEASLRTLIDLFLTDLTNQVADSLLPDDSPPAGEDECPRDDDGTDDEPDQGGEAVTFVADIQPILNERCINCHAPGGFAQMVGIPWDFREDAAFDDLVNRVSSQDADFTLVVPGDPDSSLMFLKISCESPPVGEMMPLGGPPLTDGEVQLIRAWVEQGAVKGGDDGASGGSADDGEMLFADHNCSACHCPDAGGGCALSAPAVVGAAVELLDTFLRGAETHAGGTFPFDDQETADLAAYLQSL